MIRLLRAYGDVAVGLTVAAAGIVVVAVSEYTEGPLWANVLAMLALGGLLAFRGRAPLPTAYGFLVVVLVMTAALISPARSIVIFFGLLLFSYSAGSSRHPALAWWFMPLLLVAITIVNLGVESTFSDYVFPAAISLAAYGAGRNQLVRGALAAELHEAALRSEEAQAAEERRAVAAERRRIAREMHDVVAHSISVMVVQAGGARRIIDRDPERASAAAASIEQTGRDTLLEMRRLLGVLHPGGEAPADLEPSPTLADLGALCARYDAELRVVGHTQPVPSGLEVGAYRVVQEALDDVRRVTPGAHAHVTVEWTPLALTIRVADDRPYSGPPLVGVRERVAVYGGTVSTGPRVGGTDSDGHQLEVRFPLNDAAMQGAP